MSDRVLRVGVIGCGQIGQIMHLPYLKELPQFEIAALCDISESLVEAVGAHYGVERRYTDHRALLEQRDIDCVLNITRDHAQVSIDAAEAGKHVMSEKPIAFNLEEADAVIAAAKRNRVKLMIAYMKRYDPSYQWALPLFKSMRDLRLIRVHDYGGEFAINDEIYDLRSADDIPDSVVAAERERSTASLVQAIGADRADLAQTYNGLLHLCTHDAIVLRQAFGDPVEVQFTDVWERSFVVAVMKYGDGTRCVWESGYIRGTTPWDESLTAYGADQIVQVVFPYPYLHNGETAVLVTEKESGAFVQKRVVASYDEAFKREWRHFYECVTEDKTPITSGEEGRADVKMLIDMVKAVRR
jgi:predicted dehydrogenase